MIAFHSKGNSIVITVISSTSGKLVDDVKTKDKSCISNLGSSKESTQTFNASVWTF